MCAIYIIFTKAPTVRGAIIGLLYRQKISTNWNRDYITYAESHSKWAAKIQDLSSMISVATFQARSECFVSVHYCLFDVGIAFTLFLGGSGPIS